MSVARFTVRGRMDGASSATVTIDRETGIVEVRPARRRYSATVPLSWLAETALWQRAKALASTETRARKRRK